MFFLSDSSFLILLTNLNLSFLSWALAGGSEAPNTLRNDPWLVAAPYEATALPQGL